LRYPLDLSLTTNTHSGLVYNLDCFRGKHDKYGLGPNSQLIPGVTMLAVWKKKYDPQDFPSYLDGIEDGTWHGAIDIPSKGGALLDVYSIADGEVIAKGTGSMGQYAVVKSYLDDKPFINVYQHITRVSGIYDVKEGQKIGKLYPLKAGVHLHSGFLSNYDLWDYTRISKEEAALYFMRYSKAHRPYDQFGREMMHQWGLNTDCYVYNPIKFIEHKMVA